MAKVINEVENCEVETVKFSNSLVPRYYKHLYWKRMEYIN